MMRVDALKNLEKLLEDLQFTSNTFADDAAAILKFVEDKLGMAPPRLPEEDCQAIMSVYYAGYTLRKWEEDLAKDQHVMKAKERRQKDKEAREEKRRMKYEKERP